MRKSKWIEAVEWCTLAAISLFMLGVFLTAGEQESGGDSEALMTHLEE